jgi:hypothetical protein
LDQAVDLVHEEDGNDDREGHDVPQSIVMLEAAYGRLRDDEPATEEATPPASCCKDDEMDM